MGMVGRRVASNVRSVRQLRGLSYAEFSRRLAEAGHPILDTGIMKIEKGARRVDVDDLVALAGVLNISPLVLLASDVGSVLPAALDSLGGRSG